MSYLAIINFLRKNIIPVICLCALLFLGGMAYFKGRWAADAEVNRLKLQVSEYEMAVSKCADGIADAARNETLLKQALIEQQESIGRIQSELEAAAEQALADQQEAAAEQARRFRRDLQQLRSDNDRLRAAMTGMTTAEACDAAMREVAR